MWTGLITEVNPSGDRVRVRVEGALPVIAEVTASAVAELDLAAGGEVWLSLKATDIEVYEV